MAKQIGYAVVGLGNIPQHAVLPAFTHATENSRLVAVVSDDREKADRLARDFDVTAYHIDEYRQCLQRPEVEAAYIVLPNSMRADYSVEAARAGVHVLCDKPMAVTADECRRVIRTCQKSQVKIMVAYRFHFHPAHLAAIDLVKAGRLGRLKTFSADVSVRIDAPDDSRLQRRQGGGTVYDLGVYCINSARYLFGSDPAQVMAMTARNTRRQGGDVDEGCVALIRFPDDQLAHFHTSFGEEPISTLTLFGEDGYIRLGHAFDFDADVDMEVITGGKPEHRHFPRSDPYAPELIYFSDCVLNDRQPEPSGFEGLQDVRVVEAIYRSARDGRPVTLPRLVRADARPGGDQELRKSPVESPHVL
jgi:predicted dehydrogenase